MLTAPTGQPKVVTRESALPKCAQKRLSQIRNLVDDYEAARTNLQKRSNGLMPDEVMEREEINKRIIANNQNLSYAKGLLNQVDQWLKASGALHHAVPTSLVEALPPKVGPSDIGRIENIRHEVARIKAQMIEVNRAPLPFNIIEGQLRVIVNKWASEGEPRIDLDPVKGNVTVGWGFNSPKSNKILAWIHRDALLAQLVAQAKRQYASKGDAMSPEAKSDALKSLHERLQTIELEEVALIDLLIERGEPGIQHRLDISPAALLGVKEPKGIMRSALVA